MQSRFILNSFLKVKLISLLIAGFAINSRAQLTANFELEATYCTRENIKLKNTSTNAQYYKWDFCTGDFNTTPSISNNLSSSLANAFGLKIVEDSGKFYGFATANTFATDGLYRFDFGNSLDNTPSTTYLGDFEGIMIDPEGIDIIKEGSNWIGIVGYGNNGGNLTRLIWDDLESEPVISNLGNFGFLGRLRDIKIINQNDNYIIVTPYYNGNTLVRINFGSSMMNNPTVSDVTQSTALTDVALPITLDIIKIGVEWIVIIGSQNSKNISIFNLGSDILSSPNFIKSQIFSSFNKLSKLKVAKDGQNYLSPISTSNGSLRLLDLKTLQASDTFEEITLVNAPSLEGIDITKIDSKYYVFGTRLNLSKLVFEKECSSLIDFSTLESPNVSFSQSGTYSVDLKAYQADGSSQSITKQITITTDISPDVSFSLANANRCVNTSLEFLGESPETISSWEWSFGNGDSAFVQNPSYTYTTAGTYDVSLFVESANGCTNRYIETIEIFDEPIASFTSSSQGTICSRKPVDFSNTTVLPAPATFAWDFGDGNFSTEENPSHTYPNAGTYDVSLSIEMAGCTSTVTQSLTVNPGPEVSFTQINQCYGQVIEFQNTSTGEFIIGYEWDFGDGTQSTVSNPSHQFTSTGKKAIQLTALTSNGCNYTITDSVEVFPMATVDFEIEPSCAGAPTQFLENVSVENSNIIAYNWDFGVSASSTDISSEANPLFTYASPGTYTVRLEVTTEDGCVTENSQQLEVNMLPQPEISYNTACLNESYNFSGNPNESISTEYWQIQDSLNTIVFTSTQSVFDYTFPYAGNFTITYRQQNDQLCSVTESLSLQVKELPQASFSVSDACVESNVNFVNTSELNGNELNQYSWYIDGNRVSQQQNFNFSFDQVGEYPISLELSTENGCQSIFRDTISIQALTDPFFELEQDIGAVPFDLDLNTTLNTGESAQWYINGELIGTGEALQATIEEVGVYFIGLEVSNENGCSEILNRQLSLKEPIMNIAIDNLRAIQGDTFTEFILTLTNKGSVVPSYYNINFDLGEYFITERLDAVILPGKTQNERLSVQLNNDQLAGIDRVCLSLSPVKAPFEESNSNDNSACVGISKEFKVLNIYPNPSNARVVIPIILPDSGTVEIILEQSNGQTARTETFEGLNRGYNELVVNKEELAPGVYFLRIRFEGQQKLKKIVFY